MPEKQETIFANGLMFSLPRQGAPDFVKGRLGIKVEDFVKFLQDNVKKDGFVNVNLKISKGGKGYAVLDTWVPNQQNSSPKTTAATPKTKEVNVAMSNDIEYPEEDINPEEIPF